MVIQSQANTQMTTNNASFSILPIEGSGGQSHWNLAVLMFSSVNPHLGIIIMYHVIPGLVYIVETLFVLKTNEN